MIYFLDIYKIDFVDLWLMIDIVCIMKEVCVG